MGAKAKILLVEDEHSIGFLLERMLESCEIEVITVNSGLEAIEVCKKQKIDMILMDIRMPGMSGFETSAQIRKHHAATCDVPIIAMTAALCDVEYRSYGIDECVQKPLDTLELYQTINERLGAVCKV